MVGRSNTIMGGRNDYDKIVKLACKPKNAPPKAKYLDALIAGTFDPHSLDQISRALALRLREPNGIVVFKALLTLHQMLRSGSAENLLAHLSRSDVLHLRNIQTGHEYGGGVRPPSNITTYAFYLDTRIKSFKNLRHDLVYSQTESNRRSTGLSANSKARRLRHLSVDKGLLREVKQVQRILDALIRCTFYDDDLRDENTVLAYRLLIKDLLVLFQAGNEGVCNILEHYFEMSKIDATEAFEIYKSFIKQTDKIVDYLAIARRLNNIVNVPVPTLKHAPTSLVKALEEYLNDPNFEQNRQEYKRSLGVVEGKPAKGASPSRSPKPAPKEAEASTSKAADAPAPVAATQQKIQDFLDSIETEQEKLHNLQQSAQQQQFNAQQQQQHQMALMQFGGMPQGQQGPQGVGSIGSMGSMNSMATGHLQLQPQMTGVNPFRQSVMFPQQTGMPLTGFPQQGGMQSPQGMQGMQPMGMQATGFPQQQQQATGFPQQQQQQQQQQQMQPQQTAFPQQQQQQQPGFLQPQKTGQMAFGHMQPQPTGFLQPQATGSNPFRQSSMPTSGSMGNLSAQATGFPGGSHSAFGTGSFGPSSPPSSFNPNTPFTNTPFRGGPGSPGAASPKPLTAQKTGSNNPFAPPGGVPAPAAPVPKLPNLNELAQQKYQQQFAQQGGLNPTPSGQQQHPFQQQQQPQRQDSASSPWDPLGPASGANGHGANGAGPSGMSDIASAFAMDSKNQQGGGQTKDLLASFGDLSFSPSSPGGGMNSPGGEFLQPQKTGFGGSTVKPFQPTSSFGKSLMESLPPISEPSPGGGGLQPQSTGFPFHGGQFTNSPSASPGGLPSGGGANGASSPFGAPGQSGFGAQSTGGGGGGFGGSFNPQPTGPQRQDSFSAAFGAQPTGPPAHQGSTGPSAFNSAFGSSFNPAPSGGSHSASFGAFPQRANSVSSPSSPPGSRSFAGAPFAPHRSATTDPTFSAPLQPQTTGSNPFRQSMLPGAAGQMGVQNGIMSHPTGIAAFGAQQFSQGGGAFGQSFARPN